MLKFKKFEEDAVIPCRKHETDAGLDVFARETFQLRRGEQRIIRTGVILSDCPEDVALFVWPKSGLDAEFGVSTGAGVIDPGYRGEIMILLKNTGSYDIQIEKGDAFAQLVPTKIAKLEVEESTDIVDTDRNDDGGIARSMNNEVEKD